MAVVIGDAAVAIRAEAPDAGDVEDTAGGPILDALGALGGKGAALLGGLLGGAALGAAFGSAMENEALGDKLAAQLGGSGEYAAEMGGIAGDLYADAYGESLGEVNDALRNVLQSGLLPEDATNAQIESVTASAMNLASTFDQDVAGAANAAGRMVQTGLAANAEEAMDILTRGFQQGADRGQDFIDVIGEYGTTFSELGVSGAQATGLITQALAAGIPNADFAADALREMGIIAREGGEEAAEALGDLGLSADDYFSAMQEGGPAASAALDTVLDALRNTEDPATRASAAAALVGTQYEDLGDAILAMDPSEAVSRLGDVEGAAGKMGDTLSDNAMTKVTAFGREAQTLAVDFLGGLLLPAVSGLATFLTDTLGPALSGLRDWFTNSVQPAVAALGDYLSVTFGPTLDTIRGFIEDDVMPALGKFSDWMTEHKTTIEDVATVIGILLIPALARLGFAAISSGVMTVIGWGMSAAGAVATGIVYIAQSALIVARWIAMGIAAVINAGITVGAWIGMGIAAVAQAAVVAGAWAAAQLRTLGAWALMAAGAVINAVVIGATWLLQTTITTGALILGWAVAGAAVVGGWVVMATQSLLQAGRMAAAWFIALGPIGWIAAVVIGIVALIVANWETVKSKTAAIFSAVAETVGGIWEGIKAGVKAGINGIIGLINDFVIGGVNVLIKGVNLVNPFEDIPSIPRIPKLHSGGVFDPGAEEGLAILRRQERVVTPEQRVIADNLLASLLDGDLAGGTATGAGGVEITNHIYEQPGESAAALAARITQGVVWNLSSGITRPAGATA